MNEADISNSKMLPFFGCVSIPEIVGTHLYKKNNDVENLVDYRVPAELQQHGISLYVS